MKISYTISKLSQENAEIIANQWKYEAEYSFYDMTSDPEDYEEIMKPNLRGDNYFQVVEQQSLVGFFCLSPITNQTVEVGLGLKPERTGKGLGRSFLKEIEAFLIKNYSYNEVQLSVASFNIRALTVYLKSGYKEIGRKMVDTNHSNYEFIVLKKCLPNSNIEAIDK